MYRWVRDCMHRRRRGLPEQQLEEFLAFEQSQPLLTRLNRARKEMAKVMYKGAAHSYSRRRFHGAVAHLLASVVLEPSYPIKQVSRKLTLF